jgi:NhaP-type Na+/H+ or K+/H+ antiporter
MSDEILLGIVFAVLIGVILGLALGGLVVWAIKYLGVKD